MRIFLFALVCLSSSIGFAESLTLLVFKGQGCPPCARFDADYRTDSSFRDALSMFELPKDVNWPQEFKRFGVTRVPTFVIVNERGLEVGRVNGYNGPDRLLSDLMRFANAYAQQLQQKPRSVEQAPPVAPVDNISAQRLRAIEQANDQLRETVEGLRVNNQGLSRDLADITNRLSDTASQLQAAKGELLTSSKRANESERQWSLRLNALVTRVTELTDKLKTTGETSTKNNVNSPLELPPENPPRASTANTESDSQAKRGFLKGVIHAGINFATVNMMSAESAAIVVPALAVGGPVSIGAVAALLVARTWRKKRRRPSRWPQEYEATRHETQASEPYLESRTERTQPQQPQPQKPIVHEVTKYKTVEVDTEAKRIRKAMQVVSENYPRVSQYSNLIEQTVELIKSGEQK